MKAVVKLVIAMHIKSVISSFNIEKHKELGSGILKQDIIRLASILQSGATYVGAITCIAVLCLPLAQTPKVTDEDSCFMASLSYFRGN